MESIEIEGSNIEDAVERACCALNTTTEYLEYDIISGGKVGQKVKIVARKREESEGEKSLSEFAQQMKKILKDLVKEIDSEYTVNVFEYPDKLLLNIKGDGSGLLIGKKGQTLDAIQHIMIKAAQKDEKGQGKKIIVDTEKYREKRIDYLKELAKKLAEKVIRTGKPVSVNPMSSFERRIIHITLDTVKGIYTESHGEGLDRKVVILPQDNRGKVGRTYKN